MIPVVEVPAGTSGQLVLQYRPRWLIYGGAIAAFCALVCLAAGAKALLNRAGKAFAQRSEALPTSRDWSRAKHQNWLETRFA